MDGFWFGVVVGVIAGGFFVDVNIRMPQAILDFVSGIFGKRKA